MPDPVLAAALREARDVLLRAMQDEGIHGRKRQRIEDAADGMVRAAIARSARPEGTRDIAVERELRQRLTRHHRDAHVTALTCRSCIAALHPKDTEA